MFRTSRVLSVVMVAGILGVPTLALADGDDVGLRNINGRLQTIKVNGEPPNQIFGTTQERVFGVEFVFDAIENEVKVEEPGFASQDASVLGRLVRQDILKAVRVWDAALQTFTLPITPPTLSVGKAPAFPFINTPATDTLVQGGAFAVTDDFHFDWKLPGASATSGFGIYLVELQLVDTSPTGALLTSEPLWFVFNYELPETEHDAAKDWVQTNLVPTPGAAAILGLGALAFRRRR